MTTDAGQINLGLESFKGFLGKGVQYLLGFVGTVVFARILGSTSFGGFYTLFTLVFLAEQPLRGVSSAISKRFSETSPPEDEILGAVLITHGAVYLVAAVVLTAAAGFLSEKTNVNNANLVFFALFVSIPLFSTFQKLLSASGHPALEIWNDTLRSVFTLPFQLLFVLYGFHAAGMGYGLALATVLCLGIAIYFVRRRPALPSRGVLGSIWNYAKYSIPGAIVSTAYSRLDILLLGLLLSTGAAGQYEVAYKLTTPALLISTAVSTAVFPKISNLHSRGEPVGTEVSNTLAFASVLAIPIFFGALAIPEELIVTIYGGEYRNAVPLIVGLALYQVFATQVRMYSRTFAGIDRPDINLRISFVTLFLNIALGVFLLFEYGAIGVVVATLLAGILRYFLYVFTIRYYVADITIFPRTLLQQALAGATMFVVVEFTERHIEMSGWFELLFVVGIGAITYSVVLLAISKPIRVTAGSIYDDLRA